MAPNTSKSPHNTLDEEVVLDKLKVPRAEPRVFQIVYKNLIIFGYWHIAALYGVYLCFTSAKLATILFGKLRNYFENCFFVFFCKVPT